MVSMFEVQLPGYIIQDKIYSSTQTLVYRCIREQDQKPVLIKLMCLEYPLETQTMIAAANVLIPTSAETSSGSSSSINETLDFAAIIKASQAISSTIQLDELLYQLSQIILQHSGGDRCALILPNSDGDWHLKAIATPETTELCSQPLEGNTNLPITLIQYVKNTKEIVVINDLTTDLPVIDEYLLQRQPKSVLCLPILNQGYLIGILYLKNYSTSGVFTSDHILILNFLCTQAAISLENARLHALESKKSYHLEQSQKRLQLIIQKTPVAVLEWNISFEFQAWNPAAEKVFGYREDEVLGRHFRCIIPEEYHVYVDDVAAQILSQTGGSHAINENLTKDKRRIICEWFNAPLFNSNGEVCGGVSMALDITERKQAETAVKQKSQELEQALSNLQQAQLQIVQNEKMSALGNLVAGIAHEINNPVGFISGNIQPAYEGVQDLFNLLDIYQETFPQPGEQIESEIENIDLEYLREDLPKLIYSMKEGVQRIREISNSLRTFSRADAEYKVPFNIHDGLDSTILILKHRLKANENHPAIEVMKNYGDLPQIDCFPGQLNQVFMNLLANAIDALEDSNIGRSFADIQANPNLITITTKLSADSKQVNISIKDNGVGMTQEVKNKVFDHLYTTKMVGKGTGLGLAIAHQIIVEKHGGYLEVNSAPNRGAEFLITLPTPLPLLLYQPKPAIT